MKDSYNLVNSVEDKNKKGELSLDGVVKDMSTVWETANMLTAHSHGADFFMNSPGSVFSNDVQPRQVEKKIYAEF